jgi:serine/threonine protein kinase
LKGANSVFYNLDEVKIRAEFKYDNINEIYELFEELGEGSFSKVYRARFIPTNDIHAVKITKAGLLNEFMIDLVK